MRDLIIQTWIASACIYRSRCRCRCCCCRCRSLSLSLALSLARSGEARQYCRYQYQLWVRDRRIHMRAFATFDLCDERFLSFSLFVPALGARSKNSHVWLCRFWYFRKQVLNLFTVFFHIFLLSVSSFCFSALVFCPHFRFFLGEKSCWFSAMLFFLSLTSWL